ncbi:LytR family transcriptional regulator [Pseudonocardiaceae bacterium YIM PH 21723]|nr:LytR family transcriptional regulator [Pseudonocardiaceae bacterium YIM PH 21723]
MRVTLSSSRGRKAFGLKLIAPLTLVGLFVAGASLGYLKLDGIVASGFQPKADAPLNLVLIGSDGQGAGDRGRSDTTMVVHVNKERTQATAVSIPRDTLVPLPECAGGDTGMFNSAFAKGGADCTRQAAEKVSGLKLDHFLQVDFTAFEKVIDAIGGVEVTTDKAIDDTFSGLHLKPGTHTLMGEQALAFVRTRHGVGDGGDLGRIELQQQFMKALAAKLTATRNPATIATAVSAISTDEGLSLIDLATQLSGLKPEQVTFRTLPTKPATSDRNRLEPKEPAAGQLWRDLDGAAPQTSEAPENTITQAPVPTRKPAPKPYPTHTSDEYDYPTSYDDLPNDGSWNYPTE